MKDRKITHNLALLNKKEVQALTIFLKQENDVLQKLLAHLLCFYPNFNQTQVNDKQVWQAIYGTTPYNGAKFNKLCYRLVKKTEQFMIAEKNNEDAIEQLKNLFYFYYEHQSYDLAAETLQRMKRLQAKESTKNHAYYQQQLLIEELTSIIKYMYDNRQKDLNLQVKSDALDTYYVVKKLMFFCEMLARKHSVSINYQLHLLNTIEAHIKAQNLLQNPTVATWYEAFCLLYYKKEVHYYALKNLLQQHHNLLGEGEVNGFYIYLEIMARNLFKKEAYYKELFDIYKMKINTEIIYVNGFINNQLYKNIITTAINLHELAWVENFVLQNEQKVYPATFREQIHFLTLAKINFAKKEFATALNVLRPDYKYTDIFLELDARRIELKLYYELNYSDLLENKLNAFKVFLSRNKTIPTAHKQNHRIFSSYLQKIIQTYNMPEKHEVLINELQNANNFPEKKWLLQKLTALVKALP